MHPLALLTTFLETVISLFFAIWDAYSDANGKKSTLSISFVTSGLTFMATFKVNGILLGPIWLPMFSLPFEILIGVFIRFMKLS